MSLVFDICAGSIVVWEVITAFDPKYRYNEHCKWEPDRFSMYLKILYISFILWRIFT